MTEYDALIFPMKIRVERADDCFKAVYVYVGPTTGNEYIPECVGLAHSEETAIGRLVINWQNLIRRANEEGDHRGDEDVRRLPVVDAGDGQVVPPVA